MRLANRGHDIMIVRELGKANAESACVKCGHCVDVCPAGAIFMKEHISEMPDMIILSKRMSLPGCRIMFLMNLLPFIN